MAGDILLAFGALGMDLQLAGGDLMADDSLLTAVVISLFTNRLAEPGDELPAGETDRQGWWADATLPGLKAGKDRIGSRLWLLKREKQLPSVLARAREYAEEALAWLVTEGHVLAVSVAASNPARGVLLLEVRLTLRKGEQSWKLKYDAENETYQLAE
ncbi:MAG: phage GP46 family protein [Proteobacteria bacterium]|nr:phage GP46 family protein [Pseudomonadota bacterium]MBU1594271.1 phage GP46 family protein [Pseudomonadota bacterium]